MFCLISFLMVFITIIQVESGDLTNWQALIYALYAFSMFYHTSKDYWDYSKYTEKKKGGK